MKDNDNILRIQQIQSDFMEKVGLLKKKRDTQIAVIKRGMEQREIERVLREIKQ